MIGKTKLKAGCGIFLVFSAGVLCGAIALFVFLIRIIPLSEGWRDTESKEFVMKHLANQLELNEEQVTEIQPIVYEALEDRYSHRKDYVLADIELTETALREIEPHLDEQQAEKANRMFERWKEGKRRFVIPNESENERSADEESN